MHIYLPGQYLQLQVTILLLLFFRAQPGSKAGWLGYPEIVLDHIHVLPASINALQYDINLSEYTVKIEMPTVLHKIMYICANIWPWLCFCTI